jgi:hypothetical protein
MRRLESEVGAAQRVAWQRLWKLLLTEPNGVNDKARSDPSLAARTEAGEEEATLEQPTSV